MFTNIIDSYFYSPSLIRSILPSDAKAKVKKALPTLTGALSYIKNNVPMVLFVTAFSIVNLGLFFSRAFELYFWKEENVFYTLARASGNHRSYSINFNLIVYTTVRDILDTIYLHMFRSNFEFQLLCHLGFNATPLHYNAERDRLCELLAAGPECLFA